MKRGNPFGLVKFYIVTEKDYENPEWMTDYNSEIVYLDDVEWWKEEVIGHIGYLPEFNWKYFELRKADYLKEYVFNQGDEPGADCVVIDEDCPTCSHLLMQEEGRGIYCEEVSIGKFCSNHECDYQDDEMRRFREKEEAARQYKKDNPAPKFREPDLTVQEFAVKYNMTSPKRDEFLKECVMCKKEVKPSDWYIVDGYAIIDYSHEECENRGPATIVPFSKEKKDKWGRII